MSGIDVALVVRHPENQLDISASPEKNAEKSESSASLFGRDSARSRSDASLALSGTATTRRYEMT